MEMPSPVSIGYSGAQLGSEGSSNYIRADLAASESFVDNLFAGEGLGTDSETMVNLLPTVTYNWSRPTQSRLLSYSPGYMIYEPDSSLNQFSQAASAVYELHPAQHVTVIVNDLFSDTSNNLGQGNQNAIPGTYTPGIVPFFAAERSNVAQGEVAVQTGVNVMIGGAGRVSMLHYPNPSQTVGLYGSSSRGGSAFYNRRLTHNQYAGFKWEYVDYLVADVPNGNDTVTTNGFLGFYALSIQQHFTISVAAGPQHYQVNYASLPTATSWNPSVSAAVGWQSLHSGLSLSYSRDVTGGGGELGAFTTTDAILAARLQMARTWIAGINGSYANTHNVTGSSVYGALGGHTISGGATLDHTIGRNVTVHFQYAHLHQLFPGIGSITANPNSNSEMVTFSWHFMRPLGY